MLERIATEIEGEFRVRVGMANPGGVHGIREELAAVFAEHDEIYNFLHAPVQSGSDDVLADMRRQHEVSQYRDIVETFNDTLGEWTLSTDFIVGFPTEDDDDHEASMDLLRRPARRRSTSRGSQSAWHRRRRAEGAGRADEKGPLEGDDGAENGRGWGSPRVDGWHPA